MDSSSERADSLTRAGAEILVADTNSTLEPALQRLAARGVCSMIVEGGVTLHRAFWDAKVVDRVQIYMTSHLLGADGLEWLPLPLPGLGPVTERRLGADRLAEAYVHRID
jgi:diaminohydroxyphosphoribosylaminopyrimidine deaminase/5-amino-6-(5-phosphoribosylamino)uracil reductase